MACSSLQGGLVLHFPSKNGTLAAAAVSKNGSVGLRRRSFPSAALSSSAGDLRPEIDDNPEGIISGEWPDNFSLLSYDDLRAYLETQILAEDKIKPSALLSEVMSTPVQAVTAEQTLEEIADYFLEVSGLPVVDAELRCIGVISKKDRAKASNGGCPVKAARELYDTYSLRDPANAYIENEVKLRYKKGVIRTELESAAARKQKMPATAPAEPTMVSQDEVTLALLGCPYLPAPLPPTPRTPTMTWISRDGTKTSLQASASALLQMRPLLSPMTSGTSWRTTMSKSHRSTQTSLKQTPLKSKVREVMTSPPILLSLEKTVLDAAAVMLNKKIHRIPIMNDQGQVVGIVTRSDILQVLEAVGV